jgi:hypothetical protein
MEQPDLQPVRSVTFECPYCSEPTQYPPADYVHSVLLAHATCQKCGGGFLIVNDKPMTEAEYERWSAA